jgi:hypothetical protein
VNRSNERGHPAAKWKSRLAWVVVLALLPSGIGGFAFHQAFYHLHGFEHADHAAPAHRHASIGGAEDADHPNPGCTVCQLLAASSQFMVASLPDAAPLPPLCVISDSKESVVALRSFANPSTRAPPALV